MTLTRRDRKALELAYECLRAADSVIARDVVWAYVALEAGDDMTIVKAIDSVRRGQPSVDLLDAEPVLRARLALALRALLRADAGDFGWLRWTECRCPAYDLGMFAAAVDGPRGDCDVCGHCRIGAAGIVKTHGYAEPDERLCTRRIDALWSRAPLTGAAIRPAKLRRRGGA